MDEPLLTRSQVARLLGVTAHTIYLWSRDGRFPQPIRLGARSVRYPAAAVEEWLKQTQAEAPGEAHCRVQGVDTAVQ